MLKRIVVFGLCGMFVLPVSSFGWGDKGHRTVGRVAELFLQQWNAQQTQDRIRQILNEGETLSSVATWADTVKHGKFGPTVTNADKDTRAFRRDLRNQSNRVWHFVDLPLGCASYNACDVNPVKFTAPDDIVHVINICIRVLQPGGPTPPRFSKRNALRLLTHLVGDLHQPLHVGSGYINPDGPADSILIVRTPLDIKQNDFESDHGANQLLIDGNPNRNLHSHWDGNLVDRAAGTLSVNNFAGALKAGFAVAPNLDAHGQVLTWSRQWAGDAVRVSADRAYDTVAITDAVIIDDPEGEQIRYAITRGANYDSTNSDVVKEQIVKGGYRLAKLLSEILK